MVRATHGRCAFCLRSLVAVEDDFGIIDHDRCAEREPRRDYQWRYDEEGHEIANGADARIPLAKPKWPDVTIDLSDGQMTIERGVVDIETVGAGIRLTWHCAGLVWNPRKPIGIECDQVALPVRLGIETTVLGGRDVWNDQMEFYRWIDRHGQAHERWRDAELRQRGVRGRHALGLRKRPLDLDAE